MDLNPIHHPSPAKKMKSSFLDYVQLLMIGQAGQWTHTPSATPLQPKNKMLVFGLRSTSDDRLGWLMDSNPICHPSMFIFGLCSTSDDLLSDLSKKHQPKHKKNKKGLLSHQKIKCSFFYYIQLLMIG